jgi:hypothetical protein
MYGVVIDHAINDDFRKGRRDVPFRAAFFQLSGGRRPIAVMCGATA